MNSGIFKSIATIVIAISLVALAIFILPWIIFAILAVILVITIVGFIKLKVNNFKDKYKEKNKYEYRNDSNDNEANIFDDNEKIIDVDFKDVENNKDK